jgi:hypothetical protein
MKYLKILSMLLLSIVIASSCDDPGTKILFDDAKAYLEINEATTAAGGTLAKTYNRLIDGKAIKDSLRVNLVGSQRATAVNVNFAVDTKGTTAIANFHYRLLTSGNTVTIPANSNFAYIKFEVLDDNVVPLEKWNLKINLTGGDVTPHVSLASFTRTIQTLCPYARANFIGTYRTEEPGYAPPAPLYDNVATADPANTNGIIINNFWDFGGVVKITLNANGTATLPTQDVVMGGTTYVVAGKTTLGTIDLCTYKIVLPYTVRLKSTNALQDDNTHTYTKK